MNYGHVAAFFVAACIATKNCYALPISVTNSAANAQTSGHAARNEFGGSDQDPVLASNGDGSSSSTSTEYTSRAQTASGLATGTASGPSGATVAAVSATAAASASGSGTASSSSDPSSTASGFGFDSAADSDASSTGVLAGASGPVQAWGIVYAATIGGDVLSEGVFITPLARATASVEDLTAESSNFRIDVPRGTVYIMAQITTSDGVPGLTSRAQANSSVGGNGYAAVGTAVAGGGGGSATAAAYGFFLPAGVVAIRGDNDFDGDVDNDDLDSLQEAANEFQGSNGNGMQAATNQATSNSVFDGAEPIFDADLDTDVTWGTSAAGVVATDSDYLLRVVLGTDYGDFDLDGDVDNADFGVFVNGFQNGGTKYSEGDFDGDGDVDGADFGVFTAAFNNSQAAGLSASIPEPSTALLVAVSSVARLVVRREFHRYKKRAF